MFFNVKTPKQEEGTSASESSEKSEPEKEPLLQCLIGPEGETIINEPSLLLGKEISKEPPTLDDLIRTLKFTSLGWVPLANFQVWS